MKSEGRGWLQAISRKSVQDGPGSDVPGEGEKSDAASGELAQVGCSKELGICETQGTSSAHVIRSACSKSGTRSNATKRYVWRMLRRSRDWCWLVIVPGHVLLGCRFLCRDRGCYLA